MYRDGVFRPQDFLPTRTRPCRADGGGADRRIAAVWGRRIHLHRPGVCAVLWGRTGHIGLGFLLGHSAYGTGRRVSFAVPQTAADARFSGGLSPVCSSPVGLRPRLS